MRSRNRTDSRILVALLLAGVGVCVTACGSHITPSSGSLPHVNATATPSTSKSTYAEDPSVQAIAERWGMTVYVPKAAAGSPPISAIQTIVPPPGPRTPFSAAKHEQISFGNQYSEMLSSAPLTLPENPPDEQHFFVTAGDKTVKAIAYKASWGYSYQIGNFIDYDVILNVGKVGIQFDTSRYMLLISRSETEQGRECSG